MKMLKKFMNLPFKEKLLSENIFLRTFDQNTDPIEYVWHRDREDRIIESLDQTDWMIQIDNQLPKQISGEIFIPKGVYHRVIKGSGELKIKLIKLS
jgi:hypothetical protein